MHSTPLAKDGERGEGLLGEKKGIWGVPEDGDGGACPVCGCKVESWVGNEGVNVPHPAQLGSPPKRGRRVEG